MDNSGGMSFAELLAQPDVTEEVELRGDFGFIAFHGGPVERVTTMVARLAADYAGASFYTLHQPAERPLHIPSTRVDPAQSPKLASVYDRVERVCTVHGYGRDTRKQHVLVGGVDRELAEHFGGFLRNSLPEQFPVITDIDEIPRELRGVHPKNPVNLARCGGVQVELPPLLRWNIEAHSWADGPGLAPTAEVELTAKALADAALAL